MSEFQSVCSVNDLIPDAGVNALINGKEVAIFYIDGKVYAISNYDPVGKANILSRGITGSIGDALVVAAPLYKEHYNLVTGVCVENDSLSVPVYEAKIEGDEVFVVV